MHNQLMYQTFSEQMFYRFERRKVWRRLVAFVYVTSVIVYLSWRFTIIDEHSFALSVGYYIAEVIGFILGLVTIFSSWQYHHRNPVPALEGLNVDVLVPVYQEPISVIRRTLMAAKAIEYPHNTFVLDDGHRPEVERIACELGINYYSRHDNKDAKAGNLNFGLRHSSAEFFMVLDADHIAMPYALDKLLGFFCDPDVALVQTPQDYYNIDAFQYMNVQNGRGLWHDQSFFYNIAQSCSDHFNASSCVGTGVIYRRSAIDEIGGIPTTTVTEDIHTSLKLHKSGYQTVYLNEPIAYGIAASDLNEYNKTRYRWAIGNLHCLRHENILFCKGLTLKQRLSYLSLGLIYLEGWQQLLLFLIPIISLIFGFPPFEISIFNIAVVLIFPWFSYLLLQEIGCGFTRFWTNEIFSMARWPIHIAASLGLLGWKTRWASSSKNIKGRVSWRLMAPQAAVISFSLIALAIAFFKLSQDFQTGPVLASVTTLYSTTSFEEAKIDIYAPMDRGYTVDLVLVAGFWALYSIIRALFFIRKALKDAKNSHHFYRFRIPMVCQFTDGALCAETELISENWMSTYCNSKLEVGSVHPVRLYCPSGVISLEFEIENIDEFHHQSYKVSGKISCQNQQQTDRLAQALYAIDWHREIIQRNAYFSTLTDRVLGIFKHKNEVKLFSYPVLTDKAEHAVVVDNEKLVTYRKMAFGQKLNTQKFEKYTASTNQITVHEDLNAPNAFLKGLNNQTFYLYKISTVEEA